MLTAIHHHDSQISAISAKSHQKPCIKKCFRLFSVCVYNNQTESMWRHVWWHICRHRNKGPIIFPIRKTRTNWVVQLFQCAITINHHHDPEHVQVHSTTTGPGRIMFVPKIGPQVMDDILWEESHSHLFLTHLLYGGEKVFYNHSLQDLLGLGLALILFHYRVCWLWTSIRQITAIVYCHCEKAWRCKKTHPKQRPDNKSHVNNK